MSRWVAFLAVALAAPAAQALVPMPLAGPGCDDDGNDGFLDNRADCPQDLLRCQGIPGEAACNGTDSCNWNAAGSYCEGAEWDFISYVPYRWRSRMQDPQELGLGSGLHADRAWQVSTGRFDTVIAVMDSGIRWREFDLQNKYHLNRGELPLPLDVNDQPTQGRTAAGPNNCQGSPEQCATHCSQDDPWDHNRDCVFNVQDYADDWRVRPLRSGPYDISTPLADPLFSDCFYPFNHGSALPLYNDILEPGDLICVFSDGVDGDNGGAGNGYVDDISGWDFLWDDNNPLDDTDYGHGSGEGRDSTAEGMNGGVTPGVCPSCSLLPVRTGDSFVVDANNYAEGVIFAVDSGAKVLQSAVGAINNNAFVQAAYEYAWQRGIINIASAADETAQHQSYPGANQHAEYVHAIRYDKENRNLATTWLNFSNCTNFGARLVLSAPSTGCSSGATGVTSGVAGLVASVMQDRIDGGGVAPLSGPEIHQILVHAVDDINLPDSIPGHAGYTGKRYPSREGWDMYFGYGRLNARKAIDMILDDQIPPAADLTSPGWFDIIDPTKGTVEIRGTAGWPRAASGSWVLEWAAGVEPKDGAVVDPSVWHPLATGTNEVDGVLGVFDPTTVPFDPTARIARYNSRADKGTVDTNVTKALKVNRYTVTFRLRVVDNNGLSGEDRRAAYVHRDPTWKQGFPIKIGPSGESSIHMYDLDGNGALEIIFGDADGRVHAFTASAVELTGWPVSTHPGRALRHAGSRAFVLGADGVAATGDELPSERLSSIVATVAIGDLDNQGAPHVVAVTLDGEVYAWDATGSLRAGFPLGLPSGTGGDDTHVDQTHEIGAFASPVLYDLDGDGALEIIVATLDQQVVAWHAGGTLVNGFPVSGPRDANDLTRPFLRLPYDTDADGQGRRIISSPAVGDLDGDGDPEIVLGTNEALNEQISLVYAFTFDRTLNQPVAYRADCGSGNTRKRCFPLQMVGGYPNALPYVGEGTACSPTVADVNGDGKLEVAATAIADFGRIYRYDGYDAFNPGGSAFLELKSFAGYYGLHSNSDQSSSLAMINSSAFADLDGDGILDLSVGTAGVNFVDNLRLDGERADFDHQIAAWSGATGELIDGFPQIMEDLQFFLNPLIADVDGDGRAEVVNTSGTFAIHAFSPDGKEPAGWPKFTGHWAVASPAVGDVDGDGLLELAAITRAGWLYVYELTGSASGNVQWPSFRHDSRNTGNFHTPDPTVALPKQAGGGSDGCGCRAGGAGAYLALAALALLWRRRDGNKAG